MAEKSTLFHNTRIILRPSSRKLKIALILLLVGCTVALGALFVVRSQIQQQTRSALEQAAALEQENADLTEKTENVGAASAIRQIAQEELGLVDPDTILIEPNS